MTARVLIVEDNALVSGALRVLLEASGYEIDVAQSVEEAVERATRWRPEVMLLDLTLPDGSGLDALRCLQETHAAPAATLALTGHDDDATRTACIAAGCMDVLLKPVPMRDLLAHIARAVPAR